MATQSAYVSLTFYPRPPPYIMFVLTFYCDNNENAGNRFWSTVVPATAASLGERPPALAGHFCNVPTTVFAMLMSLYPAATCHEGTLLLRTGGRAARGRYYCISSFNYFLNDFYVCNDWLLSVTNAVVGQMTSANNISHSGSQGHCVSISLTIQITSFM